MGKETFVTHDLSNDSDRLAVIRFAGENIEYYFDPADESEISDFLYEKIGEQVDDVNNVPWFMEASAWCPLAVTGEELETDYFTIEIVER